VVRLCNSRARRDASSPARPISPHGLTREAEPCARCGGKSPRGQPPATKALPMAVDPCPGFFIAMIVATLKCPILPDCFKFLGSDHVYFFAPPPPGTPSLAPGLREAQMSRNHAYSSDGSALQRRPSRRSRPQGSRDRPIQMFEPACGGGWALDRRENPRGPSGETNSFLSQNPAFQAGRPPYIQHRGRAPKGFVQNPRQDHDRFGPNFWAATASTHAKATSRKPQA